MPRIEQVEFRVRYAETDQMGVVYHSHYLVWCEIGRTDFIRRRGLAYADMEAQGMKLAVSEVQMRYHAGARYDDLVRVETQLTDVRSRSVGFAYVIRHAESGQQLVTATTSLISIDGTGRTVALRSDVRALLAAALHDTPGAPQ
jgi:acyl-CoA thioester hydrolase